jgi:hypothetical protein
MVALLVAIVAVFFWIRSRQPLKAGMPAGMDPDRAEVFFERPASFSLVIFSGDQMAQLDEFLGRSKYQILKKETAVCHMGESL